MGYASIGQQPNDIKKQRKKSEFQLDFFFILIIVLYIYKSFCHSIHIIYNLLPCLLLLKVLSSSVAAALQLQNRAETKSTETFIRMFDQFLTV